MATPKAGTLALAVWFMVLAAGGEWVDYPSGLGCCSNIQVERCDPSSSNANAACRDVCHYSGCRKGGLCMDGAPRFGRFCHCNC
ncbi:unnamed protein product [Spirodela intermedia]|uniref:Uncharacterized protein n=1 Tax=Spirodela intermedia TaxID=51605 RepID=A0A7I8LM15_SPIIN|nr:unnamed protein product [Spirodela intermedia]